MAQVSQETLYQNASKEISYWVGIVVMLDFATDTIAALKMLVSYYNNNNCYNYNNINIIIIRIIIIVIIIANHLQSSYSILGLHSRDKTAMLVYKTMTKCCSRFA